MITNSCSTTYAASWRGAISVAPARPRPDNRDSMESSSVRHLGEYEPTPIISRPHADCLKPALHSLVAAAGISVIVIARLLPVERSRNAPPTPTALNPSASPGWPSGPQHPPLPRSGFVLPPN